MSSGARSDPTRSSRSVRTSPSSRGSNRSTANSRYGPSRLRASASSSPSHSPALHERRKRGCPRASRLLRIESSGFCQLPEAVRISSSPSMKRVFVRHSGWLPASNSATSLALTRPLLAGSASHSISNAVVLPDPGSPSNTYACASRWSANQEEPSGEAARAPADGSPPNLNSVTRRGTRRALILAARASSWRAPTGTRAARRPPCPPPRCAWAKTAS